MKAVWCSRVKNKKGHHGDNLSVLGCLYDPMLNTRYLIGMVAYFLFFFTSVQLVFADFSVTFLSPFSRVT